MRPQVACERLKHRVGQRSPAVDERLEQIDADADVSGVGNEVHLAISDAERLADEGVPHRDELFRNKDEWINAGDAVIYKPFGGAIAGPMHKKRGLLIAEIDVGAARASRRKFDASGHYARPDVFSLHVNRKRQVPVQFD